MTFASLFAETMGVKSVEVVSLNSCSDEMKAHFRQAVGSCKDEAFDTVINTSENGNRVKVLLRIENNVARELVVLSSGSDLAMIRIKGKIKQSDMERAIAEHRK